MKKLMLVATLSMVAALVSASDAELESVRRVHALMYDKSEQCCALLTHLGWSHDQSYNDIKFALKKCGNVSISDEMRKKSDQRHQEIQEFAKSKCLESDLEKNNFKGQRDCVHNIKSVLNAHVFDLIDEYRTQKLNRK